MLLTISPSFLSDCRTSVSGTPNSTLQFFNKQPVFPLPVGWSPGAVEAVRALRCGFTGDKKQVTITERGVTTMRDSVVEQGL